MMGLATASVGLMSHAGWLQPWSLVVCTLLCGLGYTFYQPAHIRERKNFFHFQV